MLFAGKDHRNDMTGNVTLPLDNGLAQLLAENTNITVPEDGFDARAGKKTLWNKDHAACFEQCLILHLPKIVGIGQKYDRCVIID